MPKTRQAVLLTRCPQFLGALFILAVTAVPTWAEVIECVNLSGASDDDHRYYVVLCARESIPWGPGHAFVVWLEQAADGQVLDATGLGFYPSERPLIVRFFGIRGEIVDESTREASVEPTLLTHRLVCQVDRPTLLRSRSALMKWHKAERNYRLLACNCKHFAYEIACAIGLKPPKPRVAERPPAYINRVIDAASREDEQ
ncbi:MAG: hypothetical protein ISR77_00075 [Pirellulaceae bacterium]|nr:hypothetical protein [Pirellulaceae bacterium]